MNNKTPLFFGTNSHLYIKRYGDIQLYFLFIYFLSTQIIY